jgi:peptidyl-Lys metalloendopeptidase
MLSLVASLIVPAIAVAAAPGLNLQISGAENVHGVDNLSIKATLINTGDSTLRLLNNPNSVLTPQWKTATFTPTNAQSGARPAFKGAKVKWGAAAAAAANDFTTLAPGQKIELVHDLAGVYNFSSAGAGSYHFTAPTTFDYVTESGTLGTIQASSSSHSASIGGPLSSTRHIGPPAVALSKRATFNGCTSSRQTSIISGYNQANSYIQSTASYANGLSSGTTRYTTWFGTYTATRANLVKSHFNNMNNGQVTSDTYDCTCTDSGTYAYVYPDSFGYIYLCGAFWSAPTAGTDSKGGTIVHESSHFTRNGGTDDYVYGQTGAKSLAKSNPNNAVMNADSHEYFAENTPAQS